MKERWRPIRTADEKYYDDYEISDRGNVRRTTSNGPSKAGQIIKSFPDKAGYLRINLRKNGKSTQFTIHRLVCSTFHGPPPDISEQTCHLDGDRLNNTASNLRWGTFVDNKNDIRRHNSVLKGKDHPRGQAKLNEAEVGKIRGMLQAGARNADLAEYFKVSENTISHIKYNRTWRHVSVSDDIDYSSKISELKDNLQKDRARRRRRKETARIVRERKTGQ